MAVPSSIKFDILDWNIRADDTPDVGDKLLSDPTDPITSYAFIPNPNTVTADGFTTLISDARDNVSNTVVKSVLQISDWLPAAIPENFTFEFDVYLSDEDESSSPPKRSVPLNFQDPNNRIFIGAINQQGYTAGFLFSYYGIALAAYPEDPNFTILAGSKDLITNYDGSFIAGVNIRAVVDGENGRIAIYIAPSDSAYRVDPSTTDAPLKYNLAATKSTGAYNDSVYLQTTAPTALYLQQNSTVGALYDFGEEATLTIGSLRLASYKLTPADRPIASVYTNYQVVVGTSVPLMGEKSYDPSGKNLTYNWELEIYPEGSTASIQGAAHSTADITIPNPDPLDPNPLTVVVVTGVRPSKLIDGTRVVLEKGIPNSILSLSWDSATKILTCKLGVDSSGNITTSAADLVQAFVSPRAAGYNTEISGGTTNVNFEFDPETGQTVAEQITYPGLFRGDLAVAGSVGSEKLVEGTSTFSGGSGSTLMTPVFVPDETGIYGISLIVNNGIRNSLVDRVVFTAAITDQLLQHRPNSKYLWKYVGDFWNLVPDKDQITSMWSAMTQAVSSDLVTTWQNDYAKAIKDVSRRYQRRWLHYDAKVDIPNSYTVNIVQPETIARKDLDIGDVIYGSTTDTATVVEGSASAPFSLGKALLRTTLHQPEVVELVGIVSGGPTDTKWTLTTSSDNFPSFEVLAERTGGYFVEDTSILVQSTPAKSVVFSDPTYPISNNFELSRDLIRLYDEQGAAPTLLRVEELNPNQQANSLKFVEDLGIPGVTGALVPQYVDGFARKWDHLRESKNVSLEQTPYISFGSELQLSDYTISLGDYLELSVVDPYTSSEIDIALPVLSAGNQCIYVEWFPLLSALNMQSIIAGTPTEWEPKDLVELAIVPKAFILSRRLNKVKDLVSIPRLGETTISSSLVENLDYTVIDGQINITDWFVGTLRTEAGSDVVFPDSPLRLHTALNTTYQTLGTLDFIVENELGIDTLCLGTGDASVYKILSYNSDGSFTLDRRLEHTAEKLYFWAPKYGAYHNAPDMFWAEVSYFDNWKTIENNFGLFIGFPKELIDSHDENLDYLSVTKAIWFAFMSGPHFDNLHLGIQAMFDLPYSEVNGQIIHMEEPTEFEDGRIVIEDEDGRAYNYFYPKNATISTNPSTGNTYRSLRSPRYWEVKDKKGIFYKIVDGVEYTLDDEVISNMNDATVTAYSKLVDVVVIEDYISDPELIDKQFGGNVTTYVDEYGNTHLVDKEPTQIEKYHKFIVDVPMDIIQSTQVFPLVKTFLQEAKPAYTDFILVGSLKLADEVSVLDSTFLYPTLLLKDTPHTSPFWAKADESKFWDNTVAQNEEHFGVPEARQYVLWPNEKTLEKVASIDYTPLTNAAHTVHTPTGTYAGLPPLHPGAFHVDLIGGPFWHLVLHGSLEYGVYEDPPGSVALTPLGYILHDPGAPPGTLSTTSVGFYIDGDSEFHIFDVGGYTQGADQLVDGWPAYLGWSFDPANVNINMFTMEGKVTKFYLFDQTKAALLGNPATAPVETFWDKDDVFEKYESGYCEGVLDDYSGDGSWNFRRSSVDMVNTTNSDIDVLRSRIMVPVTKDTTGVQEDIEFEFGEPIDIFVNGSLLSPTIWDEAPPILLHIGSGVHPKVAAFDPADLTKGIFSPQFEHPDTYLLLGFDRSDGDDIHDWSERSGLKDHNAYADESRLDVIADVYDKIFPGAVITLVGRRSGAIAEIVTPVLGGDVVRRSNSQHVSLPIMAPPPYPYFLLETIWQQDKLIEYGPTSDPSIILTKYLPMDAPGSPPGNYPLPPGPGAGGIAVEDWWKASPTFDSEWKHVGAIFGGIIGNINVAGLPVVTISTDHAHHLIIGDELDIWNTDQTTIAPGAEKLNGKYTVTNVVAANVFEVNVGGVVMEPGTFGYLGHSPTHRLFADRHQKELQQHPYRVADPENEQFIPSNSPGVYSIWNNLGNPVNQRLRWGYEDEGALSAFPTDIANFDVSTISVKPFQNIHYGMKIRTGKEYHLTHGFTEFFIPPPSIKMIVPSSAGYDLRICGFYFCNDDPTRVDIPTSTPNDYGDPTAAPPEGIIGGSWVFFRNSVSLVETPVASYNFEEGINPGALIGFIGKSKTGIAEYLYGSPTQPSDGHVIELHVPALPEFGFYDIIVRNYRPYQMKSGGDWEYHMDEDSILKAFHHSTTGWGITAWGTGPFGGI
jgi:hypothetical protein